MFFLYKNYKYYFSQRIKEELKQTEEDLVNMERSKTIEKFVSTLLIWKWLYLFGINIFVFDKNKFKEWKAKLLKSLFYFYY